MNLQIGVISLLARGVPVWCFVSTEICACIQKSDNVQWIFLFADSFGVGQSKAGLANPTAYSRMM